MFSERFKWDTAGNEIGRLLEQKKISGEAFIDLTESNPTRAGLSYDSETILSAMSLPELLTYKPDPHGLRRARQAIVDYYGDRKAHIDIDDVFLTAGSSEAYSILFKLLANPGEEVLFPRPGYPLLSYLANFEGLTPYFYPMHYDAEKGWTIDLETLEALITPNCRAVVLINPNNPTGNFLKRRELAALDRICLRHGLALIVDEVFSDFFAAKDLERVSTVVNRVQTLYFVINGFSKMLALPQVKLGWIVAGGEGENANRAGSYLEMLLDFYLLTATPVQLAVQKLLSLRRPIQRQILNRIHCNERFLETAVFRTANCRMLKREGGWYGVMRVNDSHTDDNRILELMERDNTLVHPGYFYDFRQEGYVVVSLLPEPQAFQTGVVRLIKRFGR